MADQRRGKRAKLFELLDLPLEPRVLQRAFGDQQQPVGLERLLDEVIGAALDRRNRGLDVAVAGNHHDRQFGMVLLEDVEQLQPVEPAALQPDVEENQVGPAGDHCGERFFAVAGGARAVAFVLQNAGDQLADIDLVINDQDIGCHDQTVALCGFHRRGGSLDRLGSEAQLHPCTARACNFFRSITQFDAPAVLFENAADNGQSQSGALLTRRHVGLQQSRAVFLRQADPVVDHVDQPDPCRRAAHSRQCGRGRA